jgi:putative DNA primase/helicase
MSFQSTSVPSTSRKGKVGPDGNVIPIRGPRGGQAGAGSASAPRKKGPTVEFRLASSILTDSCPYLLGRQESRYDMPDTTFYEWVEDEEGQRWQALNDLHLRGMVSSWLRRNISTDLSSDKIGSCIKVLRDLMIDERKTLPAKDRSIDIVPLRNAYLIIDKQGVIRAVKPDRRYGQTYTVQADLDWDRVDSDGVYTPAAPTAGGYWHTYLSSTFQDPGVYDVAQEAFSMALLSQCYEKGVLMHGDGENGKSVMLHILRSIAPGATAAILPNRLVKNEFGTNSLIAKKIAVVAEMPRVLTAELQGILKALISRDALPGEYKGKDQFTFIPEAAWFMATNHFMQMPEHEHGWHRKIVLIPFLNRVSKESKILNLEKMITGNPSEMIQVVDWLLIGGARLTKAGRFRSDDEMPEAISNLTHVQRVDSDTVAAWIEDAEPQCSNLVWTSKTQIYAHYRNHVIEGGRNPVASNAFWKRIAAHFRNEQVDTEGKQMTIAGMAKRDRYVQIAVPDVKPGKVLMSLAEVEAAAAKAPPISDADWPASMK